MRLTAQPMVGRSFWPFLPTVCSQRAVKRVPYRSKGDWDVDQIRIGKFIAACRKAKGLTQAQLAERLSITDRAVSKWETGRSMPDSAIILPLCTMLDITVNDLLSGERIEMEKFNKTADENLVALMRRDEAQTRMLLRMEIVVGLTCSIAFSVMLLTAVQYVENTAWRVLLIATAIALFCVGVFYAMKLEREAGYYECPNCGHRYVPEVVPFWMAMHMGRTRYMKCPGCGRRGWQKKVLSQDRSKETES